MTLSSQSAPAAAALDYESTLIAALKLSSKKCVFAMQLPNSTLFRLASRFLNTRRTSSLGAQKRGSAEQIQSGPA